MKTDIKTQMDAEKPDDVLADLEAKHGLAPARLLACPFCGGTPGMANEQGWFSWWYFIKCHRCGARGPNYRDVDEAAKRWNTRKQANDRR